MNAKTSGEKIIKDEDKNLFFSGLHSDPWYECPAN